MLAVYVSGYKCLFLPNQDVKLTSSSLAVAWQSSSMDAFGMVALPMLLAEGKRRLLVGPDSGNRRHHTDRDSRMKALGWQAVRVWAHEFATEAAELISRPIR